MVQPEASFLQARKSKVLVALLLTFASGIVDITGFLGIIHLFTAHLTGITVHLGSDLIAHAWRSALATSLIVVAFAGGSLFGRIAVEIGWRRGIRRIASITITTELLLLLCVAVPAGDSLSAYAKIACLAAAMGVQTATLTRIGPLTVHTTFVTGMVNKTTQLVSHILFRTYDLSRAGSDAQRAEVRRKRKVELEMALLLACVWCFFVGGAAFGTWTFGFWGMRALFTAVGLLAFALAIDAIWPLSIEEEKEQSER